MSAIFFLNTVLMAGLGSLGDDPVSLSLSASFPYRSSDGTFSSESGLDFPRLDFPDTHTHTQVFEVKEK